MANDYGLGEALWAFLGQVLGARHIPGFVQSVPRHARTAATAPGSVLLRGRSRTWRPSQLLLVPGAGFAAAFLLTGGLGAPWVPLGVGALAALGALAHNAWILATDGTWLIETRRLVFRMRAGVEQSWALEPVLQPHVHWRGDHVFLSRLKALLVDGNADGLAEVLKQLCAPALTEAKGRAETAWGRATLGVDGGSREGAAILRESGAYFVAESDGADLLAALTGLAAAPVLLSASAVVEVVRDMSGRRVDEALEKLVEQGEVTRCEPLHFAAELDGDPRAVEVRRAGKKLSIRLADEALEAWAALRPVWRNVSGRLDRELSEAAPQVPAKVRE
jgi:hypothetical protein